MHVADWASLEASVRQLDPRGIVWDFDGVLCDSAGVFSNFIAEHLAVACPAAVRRFRSDNTLRGKSIEMLVTELLRGVVGLDAGRLARQLAHEYEAVASQFSLDREAIGIVHRARARGVAQCIVSNGGPDFIRAQIAKAGVGDAFDFVITPTERLSPKPAPSMYESAMERLGLRAHECLVIDDSEVGSMAARAAGIRAVRTSIFSCRIQLHHCSGAD